jgi:hypothetical protein
VFVYLEIEPPVEPVESYEVDDPRRVDLSPDGPYVCGTQDALEFGYFVYLLGFEEIVFARNRELECVSTTSS